MGKVVARQVKDALKLKFGPMKAVIGKEHGFPGSIRARRDGRIFEASMASHSSDVAEEFGEIPTELTTPARLGLLEVDFLKPFVDEERRFFFHYLAHKAM